MSLEVLILFAFSFGVLLVASFDVFEDDDEDEQAAAGDDGDESVVISPVGDLLDPDPEPEIPDSL
ncbi:MAG: hypothetical protein AAFR45_03125 [Pseudomonadota bacterium]